MTKIHKQYRILSLENICDRFVHLVLDAEELSRVSLPGQILNVRVNDGLEPVFRRPFGIHRYNGTVGILFEVRGKGTQFLAQKKPGDMLDILAPLGNTFTLPEPEDKNIVFIAGGIGVAPLLSLAASIEDKGRKKVLLYGCRDKGYVFDKKRAKKAGCEMHIATDDGSAGVHGNISRLFDLIPAEKDRTRVYVCGPVVMMKCVQEFARANGLRGECLCEEVMACGTGACRGCVIKTIGGYKTVCQDGPVFDLGEVVFD